MSVVYFMRRADGTGPIKIGCSAHLEQRIAQLSSDHKAEMIVLAQVAGAFRDEARLHRQFAGCRLEGEWFEPTRALLSAVDHVAKRGTLPPTPPSDRDMVMAKRYLGGETLEAIATDFGLTRERVRQILRATGIPSLGWRPEHLRSAAAITDEEREIAKRYLDGESKPDLKAAFPHLCIEVVLARTEVAGKKRTPERTLAKAEQVVEAYKSGFTPTEIAERFGFAHGTYVYRQLKRAGFSPSRRPGFKRGQLNSKLDEVVTAYTQGLPLDDIAQLVGASTGGVAGLLRRNKHLISASAVRNRRALTEARRVSAVVAANHRRHGSKASASC